MLDKTIRERIKQTLEQLEPVEMAFILSWMKDNGYLNRPPQIIPDEEKRGDRIYLKARVRDNLNGLDEKQLAKLYSWMQSGEMYNYGAAIIGNQSTAELVKHVIQKED